MATQRMSAILSHLQQTPVSAVHCVPAVVSHKVVSNLKHKELLEYSVVYTDRARNLMSPNFTDAMMDISRILKTAYNAQSTVLIPGSGSYAMEAAARHFGGNKKVLVVRNGYFSFRWSDIFAVCKIPATETVLMARPVEQHATPYFAPPPIDDVVAAILSQRPDAVFCPHVETSTGIILPGAYIAALSQAVRSYGGYLIVDAIASGTVWLDMAELGIDALISAPQKGWSGPAGVGIVMLGDRGAASVNSSAPSEGPQSFACNLPKWAQVMQKYEAGGFMYYTTLPTDALSTFRDVMLETESFGLAKAEEAMWEQGSRVRALLAKRGYKSVAAAGFESPGVVVCYADNKEMVARFKQAGLQIAGGVPFKLNEPQGLMTFRLGLFGLDKIYNIDATVRNLERALDSWA